MILYIHIPFCMSKCGYCAFNSIKSSSDLHNDYVNALILDLSAQIENQEFSSIYFGGGTPNILHQKHYERIFELIRTKSRILDDCEITLECNPNLVHLSWCQSLRELGANRISLGVQSFFDDKLDFLQRDHQKYDVFSAIECIAHGGFDHVSIDLIYNTPFDDLDFLKKEIQCVQSLGISHISAYALSIDKGSKFYQNPPKLSKEDRSMFVREMLDGIGFRQYEVSSYCKHHKSRHNLAYWRGEDYLGCGSGGVGCVGKQRMWGNRHIQSYIKNPLKKTYEILSEDEKRFERIFLGLRCELGVSLEGLCQEKIRILLEEKKCFIQEERLIASDFFLADEIALWLS